MKETTNSALFCLQHSILPYVIPDHTFMLVNFNPLTPRVKPWITKKFLAFDYMDRTLRCDHSLVQFVFQFTHFVILENLAILDLALSEVQGLIFKAISNSS